MIRWFDLTLSPLAFIALWVQLLWWRWARHDSMILDPAGPGISEQVQAINNITNRMRAIEARWNGR